jgi:predicted Zn finger-like uncharacterized protein
MDVRCESCHTEYELDDGNVSEAGTDVQCTFCGHTFIVYPPDAAPTVQPGLRGGAGAGSGEAEYLLETADGRTQRLRDLTVLQKWIIERRVTRADRIISKNGQPWTRLGALDDLAPFFDVVDEADRARAAAGRTLSSEALPSSNVATPPAGNPIMTSAAGAPVSSRAVTPRANAPRGSTPQNERAVNRSLEIMAVEAPSGLDEPETTLVRRSGRGWWKLFVSFGVAAAVAYTGIRVLPAITGQGASEAPGLERLGNIAREARGLLAGRVKSATEPGGEIAPGHTGMAEPAGSGVGAGSPASPDPAGSPTGGTTLPAAATVGNGAQAAPGAGSTASAPAPAPGPATALAVERPAPSEPAAEPAKAPAAPATRPKPAVPPAPSYDKLVAQADQLLDAGSQDRAIKVYQQALTARPNAPEALAGIGYAHLDRQRISSAVQYFIRASASAPYAPALFGLGRAYRSAGDNARARDTFQRYLNLFPTGSDAPAAERQLQQLGEAPAPAEKEGGTPASILQEGGTAAPTGGTEPPARPLDAR